MPAETQDRHCVVVLGMHRSGTSALSGMLAHLGCGTPRSIAPADENNQRGYFESIPFWKLSEDILEAAGSKWDDWHPILPEALTREQWAGFSKRAQWVLDYEFQDQKAFVLKDPRMCRLLPFWVPEIQAFGCKPHFVLTHRHPTEVASSLARRNEFVHDYGLLMWLHYVLQAEQATRGEQRVFVSYDHVLSDWRQVLEQIRTGLDLALPALNDENARAIDDFLSAKLRRFQVADGTVPEAACLPDWVQRCHEIFDAWAQAGETPDDHAELDRIAQELAKAAPAFRKLVDIAHDAGPAQLLAAEELATAQAETDRLQGALSALQDQLEARMAEQQQAVVALQASQDALQAQQAEHAQDMADKAQALQHQQTKLAQITGERDAAWQELRTILERAEDLQRRLEAALQRSADLEHANLAMSQSTSWKVTRPLRAVGRLTRLGKHMRNQD